MKERRKKKKIKDPRFPLASKNNNNQELLYLEHSKQKENSKNSSKRALRTLNIRLTFAIILLSAQLKLF